MKRIRRVLVPAAVAAAVAQASAVSAQMPDMAADTTLLVRSFERTVSGTAWEPEASSIHHESSPARRWEGDVHGVAFAQYDYQSGRGTASQVGSVNWIMGTVSRGTVSGYLHLRGMVSADAFTLPGNGYPLLLQTGEVFHNEPIHDRQHPHDLFMELSATYEHRLSHSLGISIYAAPVGEPATGPAAYMHRASAAANPFAPISHHWQDATHISFGVATVGLFTKWLRLEGSLFNAGEPDQVRTNFDYKGHKLNSRAGRVTLAPSSHWTFSASYAFLQDPEPVFAEDSLGRLIRIRRTVGHDDVSAAEVRNHLIVELGSSSVPKADLHRAVLSASYATSFGNGRRLAATTVWSRQKHDYDVRPSMSVLVEETLSIGSSSFFSRVELVQKTRGELSLPPPRFAAELIKLGVSPLQFASIRHNVGEATIGMERSFVQKNHMDVGVGILGILNFIPDEVAATYGSGAPRGFAIYVRVAGMVAAKHHGIATM
jgi:hypothetical protein